MMSHIFPCGPQGGENITVNHHLFYRQKILDGIYVDRVSLLK